MSDYLYRVRVTDYPAGAFRAVDPDGEVWEPAPGWTPPGWTPEGRYVEILGTSAFVWPVTNKEYRSRSTARRRADLLERYGATVVIERSSRIVWPAVTR